MPPFDVAAALACLRGLDPAAWDLGLSPENARRLYRLVQQHGSGNVSIRVKG